jgi:CRISPR/Cas system CMR-associated protein Cmr5 small subunit
MMAQLSRQQTLEQQRATKAWEAVNQVKDNTQNARYQEAYNSWVKKSPC